MKLRNTIFSSLLAVVLCMSIIAGGTFALFTSTVTKDVVVTSGKVDVTAEFSVVKTYSLQQGVQTENSTTTFATGGTAEVDSTTGKISLSNVVPGDKADIKITVTNVGTVAALYRVKIAVDSDTGLAEALKLTVGTTSQLGVLTYTSTYKSLPVNAANGTGEVEISLEFPANLANANEYAGKTATYKVTVEAIQGNASTTGDAETVLSVNTVEPVATATELTTALNAGKDVYLTEDITDGTPVTLTSGTIVGNGHKLYATPAGEGTITLENVEVVSMTADNFNGTLKINGGVLSYVDAHPNGENAALYIRRGSGSYEFKNLTISGTLQKGIKVGQGAKDIVIENCTFDVDAVNWNAVADPNSHRQSLALIDIQTRTNGTTNITIKNNTFKGAPQGSTTVATAVDSTGYLADSDTAAAIKLKAEVAPSNVDNAGFGTVTITGNTFINCYRDIVVGTAAYCDANNNLYAAHSSNRTAEVAVRANSVSGANWTISGNTTTLDNGTITTRGVAVVSAIGVYTGFDKCTTIVRNVGSKVGGCGIWVIANAFELSGTTYTLKNN